MGVYIKGMEMPTSCIACLLNFGEKRPEYGLTIYCPYSDGVISWRDKAFDNGRLASCGIIPVPPHGRLIDADALIESNKYLRYNPAECEEGSYDEGWAVGFNAGARHATEHAVYAPTIIEAEGMNDD